MAVPSNLITGETPNVGAYEDLEDKIYRVAAEETPFSKNIGKAPVSAIRHEWQIEGLATPDPTNARLEGDDVGTLDAGNLTSRISNICHIMDASGGVSRTQGKVNLAGRSDEYDRQVVLKGIELKRDWEARIIGNFASVEEAGATTRKSAGALAFITSNDSRGAGGSDGGFSTGIVAAATNGTQRTFTEALVKGVLATAFGNGGRPKQGYMGATHKQQFSAFTGIASIRTDAGKTAAKTVIVGAADVYVSDFGNITLIPHPYGLTRDALFIDPEYWAVGTLDEMQHIELAKQGDSDRFQLVMEKTLVCRNEKSSAVVADLT